MAEYQVLSEEPGHKVRSFTDELLERRKAVIKDMKAQLIALGGGMLKALAAMKDDDPFIDMETLRFEETKWTKDGKLVIWITTLGVPTGEKTDRYYVDNIVADLIEKDEHMNPVSGELAQFMSALIDQFGFMKKQHGHLDLDKITFAEMHWVDDRLVFSINYNGAPLTPREARW